jgi:alkylated DNA repair dioxygenase AlkB
MAQLALFESGPRLLVDDPTGRIEYTPDFVDSNTSARWFAALRDDVPWRGERRRMYDRDVDVPRQHAAFRLDTEPLPDALGEAAARVRSALEVPFNGAGLNLYRDGRDSVAPHNDHLYEIVEGFPIALLSLGSTRRMTIRSKSRPRRVLDLDLEPGSLLVMSYETQLYYDHGVPKTSEPVGERISIALRVKPAA